MPLADARAIHAEGKENRVWIDIGIRIKCKGILSENMRSSILMICLEKFQHKKDRGMNVDWNVFWIEAA